ncbi:hypothetical protein [Promicromonospora kroppenstedtii]|uniref:hypothetical protein n=1 Tax=Promicromonospora kroppenstedtii TaxID=440482 RepID=UPI0004AEDA38|nr:hypothetical protein [Promicromonospora kroppenstedtii]
MPVKIDVLAQADASSVADLGKTLDDVAAGGESMGAQIEAGLEKAEAAARPTKSEFRELARTLDDLAAASGKTKTEALDDLKRAAAEAGTELKQGTLDALERLAAQGPRDVDKVREAVDELKRSLDDVEIDIDTEGPLTKTQDLLNEVKASVNETMGELAGSFAENGFNMADALDGVVEVAAEAATLLPGPWSLAGAAMVTVAAGVYGEWKQRMEQIAEDASAMYEDLLNSGQDYLSDEFFQGQLRSLFDPMGESYDDNMKRIDLLKDLGVPAEDAALALIGYGDTSDRVLGKLRAGHELLHDDIRGNAGAYQDLGLTGEQRLSDVIRRIEDSQESFDTAKGAANQYRDSISRIPNQKNTEVKVSDKGTTAATQRKINGIDGRDIPVQVRAYLERANQDVAAWRAATAALPVSIQIRAYGQAAV